MSNPQEFWKLVDEFAFGRFALGRSVSPHVAPAIPVTSPVTSAATSATFPDAVAVAAVVAAFTIAVEMAGYRRGVRVHGHGCDQLAACHLCHFRHLRRRPVRSLVIAVVIPLILHMFKCWRAAIPQRG